MSDGKIIQENGENIIPITHETCVLDDEGNPITETIGDVSLLNTESRNLVGAINEVFGDTIKEQVVNVLVDNDIEATTSDPWSGLIEKIDSSFEEKNNELEENRTTLINLMQASGYDVSSDMNMTDLLTSLELNGFNIGDVKKISCGYGHTLILKNDGSLWACGYNQHGQLGTGQNTTATAFARVIKNINNDVKELVCGSHNTFIIKNDGSLWGCGNGANYQFGNNSNSSNFYNFTQITTNINNDVKQIIAGNTCTLVIKNDGSLWGTGSNVNGELGLGSTQAAYVFTKLLSDVQICDCSHIGSTFVLKNDGTIWVTGYNYSGQLGLGDTTYRKTFTQVTTNINNIKQISCGSGFTFILTNDGKLYSCGGNNNGQLGLGDTTQRTTFTQVTTNINNDVKYVTCGSNHTFIIKNDGSVWACGNNGYGELGLGDKTARNTFTKVTTNINNDVKQIACGRNCQTLMLKNDGSIWGTGYNFQGMFGLGDATNETVFTRGVK